jgi:hypothetical protein
VFTAIELQRRVARTAYDTEVLMGGTNQLEGTERACLQDRLAVFAVFEELT